MDGRRTCGTTFVNTDILTYLCDLCDVWAPPAGGLLVSFRVSALGVAVAPPRCPGR